MDLEETEEQNLLMALAEWRVKHNKRISDLEYDEMAKRHYKILNGEWKDGDCLLYVIQEDSSFIPLF